MKYGQDNIFNFSMVDYIKRTFIRYADGEEGAGGGEEKSASQVALDEMFRKSPGDEAKPGQAPESSASGSEEKSESEEGEEDKEPPQGQAPEITDDDIAGALNPEESADAKVERLERDYSASSKEAKRLKNESKALNEALESQGLKVVIKDGKASLVATEKYSDQAASFDADLSKLSTADQEALESGDLEQVSGVVGKLIEKAKEAYVRAQPNLDREPISISDEKKSAVFESMAAAVDVNDQPKHENFSQNQKHIEGIINNSAVNESVREAFAAAPEFMSEVLNNHINAIRSKLEKGRAAKQQGVKDKEKEAEKSTATNVQDTGKKQEQQAAKSTFLDSVGPKRS